MVQEIKYKGLTRLPSDVSSFDGEMEEVYNLFNVNGELRPYVPPEQIGTLSGVLRFVHKNQGWEHLITLDGSEVKAYKYKDSSISQLGTITNIYGEELLGMESVGNTLIILTNKEIKYVLWKDGYNYLGNKIPFPNISFKLRDAATSVSRRFWDFFPDYSADIQKLNGSTGFNPRGSGGSRTSSSGRTGKSVVSSDFENAIFGKINDTIQALQDESILLFPFFVRYAVRLYDGSLIRHSQPFLMLPSRFAPFHISIADLDKSKIEFNFLYASFLTYSSKSLPNISAFSDIIESVDIFMSAPIYSYMYDGYINGMIDNPDYIEGKIYAKKIMGGFFKNKDELLKEISSTASFYKVLSIPIDSFSEVQSTKDLKVENADVLVTQERMTDDYLTHDTIIAENSFSYNHKLHLTGIKSQRFEGFKLFDNDCRYEGVKSDAVIDIGEQPYIFYPNAKCGLLQMTQNTYGAGGINFKDKFITLSAHQGLNGSFYLNPTLENIENDAPVSQFPILPFPATAIDEESNKIYVSELNNPFYFPVNSRVTLPVGRVIAISSNTEAISAGQFGQFPLYAFTDDGIWALEVSSDGKYLARQPVSREVITNPNVLQMDKYIAFVSKRGLNILSGSSTECITEIVREVNTRSSKVSITSFVIGADTPELPLIYNTVPIEEYMLSCELAYEYINGQGRIYMINNNFDYCYVFDIMSKSWSKVQGKYRNSVANYPDCYVQNTSGNIFNLASIREGQGDITTMYMTRPIKMEQALFSLKQLAHVGVFNNGDVLTCVYASRDGINYAPIASGRNRLLRISGTPYRYYKVAVIANLQPNETLSSIQLNVEPKFTNRIR